MNFLLTGDLHFTDNPRDSYRFGLFPWLLEQQKKYNIDATFILGDITDAKDKHSAGLVNSIINGLRLLKPPVYIVMGNHDFINPSMPFFYFLSYMDVYFLNLPTAISSLKLSLIPYQPTQETLDEAFRRVPAGWGIMCHQTFTGAKNELGAPLTGFKLPPNNARVIYSGDVHAPQTLSTDNGDVIYLGSPYHVRFGDNFTPRVLLLAHDKRHNLRFPAPRKIHATVRQLSDMPSLNEGDQVKVTMELGREDVVDWANRKQAILDHCKALGVGVYGTELRVPQGRKRIKLDDSAPVPRRTNADYFTAFCSAEKVSGVIKKVGSELL